MHALILADGDAPTRDHLDAVWPGWDDGLALVIAADGGARHGDPLGVTIDRWVGDGDSLDPAALAVLEARGVPIERANTDKDESDTELAVVAALTHGATRLTIVGALGGPRLDHALANIALLALDDLVGVDCRILSDQGRVRLLRAPAPDGSPVTLSLHGRVGDLVSILPTGGPALGVTTSGLRYVLRDQRMPEGRALGLSNVRERPNASVTARSGRLIIVESPATL